MKAASSLLAEAIRDEVRSWRSGPFACRRPAPSRSVHRGSATLEGGGQEIGMDGRHGSAVGQGDVIELLREPGRDPRVEAHELIRGVVARAGGWPTGARRR